MLSFTALPGNSGEFYHKRRRLIFAVYVIIMTLFFTYGIIAQQLYSLENNYDFSASELFQGLIDEEVSISENNKFQSTFIQLSTLFLVASIYTGIHSYQLSTTYHVRSMKVILRL